jgi:hypothetical protein
LGAQQPYNSTTEIQLPTSAPLVYPPDERSIQQTGLKKMGHFIADYGDKRAQARFVRLFLHEDVEQTLTLICPSGEQ